MFACYLWVTVPPEWTAPTTQRWAWARDGERGRARTATEGERERARRDWDHFTLTRWYALKNRWIWMQILPAFNFRFSALSWVGRGNYYHHLKNNRWDFFLQILFCRGTACAERKCTVLLSFPVQNNNFKRRLLFCSLAACRCWRHLPAKKTQHNFSFLLSECRPWSNQVTDGRPQSIRTTVTHKARISHSNHSTYLSFFQSSTSK